MLKYIKSSKKQRKRTGVHWQEAPDIKKNIDKIISTLNVDWLKKNNIYCFRSQNSSSRAYARIWGLSKIWQIALDENPSYIIEVLSEKFDKLPGRRKDEVLIHELAHIPKTFSGSLLPHIRKSGKRNFNHRVRQLILKYQKQK